MASENENISEWCLIESNPCIFYDMMHKMGAKNVSIDDVHCLDYFDDYMINKDEVSIKHILSIEKYKNEKEKLENVEKDVNENTLRHQFYNDDCIEIKYDKLLKNSSYIYGIIFLFNVGKNYNNNKFIEHEIPENLFFAKQVIPNACATQAILSIVLNKDIELNDEIKNIKTFSTGFDSSMKGLTLSNCNFLRNIHNSYKTPIHIDREDFYDNKKSSDAFHFVSYIQYRESVYLLDGLQNGPVLIKTEQENSKESWIEKARDHIKKEIDEICNSKNDKDNRFNVLVVIKDKEHIIQNFINVHRVIRQRTNIKLLSIGENIELNDEINEDDYDNLKLPTIDDLPDDLNELSYILQKSTLEINYLESLLNEQVDLKKAWHKELTFKFFNFYPFIMSSLHLMAKHKLLKENYQNEKSKKSAG